MSAPLLELDGVGVRYAAAGEAAAVDVLRDVNLVVDAGTSLAIVGPSGSGKSSLLHVVGGLLPPSSGSARFDGQDLGALDADARARLRNTQVGFVFQQHHLLPQCTALENVLLPTLAGAAATSRADAAERASSLLAAVGLGERLQHRPGQLSGGECQRVAVVRALINRPRVVLADEPTGSLDGDAAEQLGAMLVELVAKEQTALVVVTHAPGLANRMQRSLRLEGGRLLEAGAVA